MHIYIWLMYIKLMEWTHCQLVYAQQELFRNYSIASLCTPDLVPLNPNWAGWWFEAPSEKY